MNRPQTKLAAFFAVLIVLAGVLTVCRPREVALAGNRPVVRFGIVTDVHYADTETREARPYRESLAKLAECVEVMNRRSMDFLIELGDFKDQDETPVEAKTLLYLQEIEKVFAGFSGRRYHVLGNHDLDSLSKSQFLAAAGNSGIAKTKSYYAFSLKDLRFIVLDADFRSDGSPYDRGNFEWGDSNVPPSELKWLASELAASSKRAVVFIHQQLDGEGDYFVKNAADVREILEKSRTVLAVFQGHRHEGAYSRINGIHYYTLIGMIEGRGATNNSYAIVDVYPGGDLEVKGYRRASSRGMPKGR
jgi:predicted phosphodiesterase